MYSDEAIRKAHLEDFIKVYDRVKKILLLMSTGLKY